MNRLLFFFLLLSLSTSGQILQPDKLFPKKNFRPPVDTIINPVYIGELRFRSQDTAYYTSISLTGTKWRKLFSVTESIPTDNSITMTQLRAVTTGSNGDTYYITDAGKEGYYKYDASDNTSSSNTGTVVVTAGNLRMKRLDYLGNFIDPATDTVKITWFGCVGDSTFDNTDTLEAIIGMNFKRIHVPDGYYRVVGSSMNSLGTDGQSLFRGLMIRNGTTITGNGTHKSFFVQDGITPETEASYYNIFTIRGDTTENVNISGLTFRGKNFNGAALASLEEAKGIFIYTSAQRVTIDSCKFEYLWGHGVADFGNAFQQGGYNTITRCVAQYNAKNGFNMNAPYLTFQYNVGHHNQFSLLEASTGHAEISYNTAYNNNFLGIAVGGYGDSTEAQRDGGFNYIHHNTIYNQQMGGLSLSGGTSHSLVYDNLIYYNGDAGLLLSEDLGTYPGVYTRYNWIYNNSIYDNGKSTSSAPQGVYISGSYNSVFNNFVKRNGNISNNGETYSQKWGIITAQGITDLAIWNNDVSGHGSQLGDYYFRLAHNKVWTDTGFLAAPNNPWIRLSVEPRTAAPYAWSQVYGSLVIGNPTGYEATLSGIDPTTVHTLQLNYNSGSLDSISFISTKFPTANAGADFTTALSSVTLSGSGSDVDGSIASYEWHIVRAPNPATATLTNANTATPTLNNIVTGTYIIRLYVVDNLGAKNFDEITITK